MLHLRSDEREKLKSLKKYERFALTLNNNRYIYFILFYRSSSYMISQNFQITIRTGKRYVGTSLDLQITKFPSEVRHQDGQ